MDKEYVDREALYNKLHTADFDCYEDHAMVENIVFLFPAADATPVVHGRWVLNRAPYGQDTFKCSICKKSVALMSYYFPHKYCPNCGAKMDLEEI